MIRLAHCKAVIQSRMLLGDMTKEELSKALQVVENVSDAVKKFREFLEEALPHTRALDRSAQLKQVSRRLKLALRELRSSGFMSRIVALPLSSVVDLTRAKAFFHREKVNLRNAP